MPVHFSYFITQLDPGRRLFGLTRPPREQIKIERWLHVRVLTALVRKYRCTDLEQI
jgi:hypothetical protein